MWIVNCPDGPSAMFRVLNTHTVAELNLDARRVVGVRNLLVFDTNFSASTERRLMRALLIRAFSVPKVKAHSAAHDDTESPARHTLSFTWLQNAIFVRAYRNDSTRDDTDGLSDPMRLTEIGPRLVLRPVRIIASGFSGTILHGS